MDEAPALRRDTVAQGLRTMRFGRPLSVLGRVDSTNEVAKELAEQGASEGTAVIAREQTAGRGRLGRPWRSPPGGLWMSVVLRPVLPASQWPLLGFAAALAAAEAIEGVAGVPTQLKWPNDLIAGGRKVGGILVEAGGTYAVAGIGINANVTIDQVDSELAATATSLETLRGGPVDLPALAREVLSQFERFYDVLTKEPAAILQRWRERSTILGRRVQIVGVQTFEGLAEDVDMEGALLVRTLSGVQRVYAGEVSLREAG